MTRKQPVAPELLSFLVSTGLATPDTESEWIPLAGGVSSDIWQVVLPDQTLCVKRALPKLKVAADWEAPISRNAYEWEWMKFAAQTVPSAVPTPIAHDEDAGLFAMSFLEPDEFPVWKLQLMDGDINPEVAEAIGTILGKLHQASADSVELAEAFATDESFYAIRLEPYLLATAKKHPALSTRLHKLAEETANRKKALVHGDVSPKNILVGADGPIILDAECAWYGDPAFDVAFFLNHMLLKCIVKPELHKRYLECFDAFRGAYFKNDVDSLVDKHAAALLPALLLARVDGKSPVEYITSEKDKGLVREFASTYLLHPAGSLKELSEKWAKLF